MATTQAPQKPPPTTGRAGPFRALLVGYRAGRNKAGVDTNPYEQGTGESFAWVRGYGQAIKR